MKVNGYRIVPRYLSPYYLLAIIVVGTWIFCPTTMATEAADSASQATAENTRPGAVGLSVTGASAGITPDYFEQAVIEALIASEIFSEIDNSKAAETIMPMIRTKGVFPGYSEASNTPYFLNIRIIKVDAPSFSTKMTVGLNAVWTLYRVADKAELLSRNIFSTYTGGLFDGGIIGANRVRVATEGAARENVRIGVELLGTVDLEQPPEPIVLEQGALEQGVSEQGISAQGPE
jgi:hypothetical protein